MGDKKIKSNYFCDEGLPEDPFAEEEDGSKSYNYAEDLKKEDLNRGVIYLFNGVNDVSANLFSMEINHILRNPKIKNIIIDINSPGGEVYSALNVYNTIRNVVASGRTVMTIVNGLAASAAAMIVLQAGSKRVAHRNARLLLHEPRRMVFMDTQTSSNMKDEVKAMDAVCDILYDILSEKMDKTREEVSALIDRKEVWLSAEESLEHGLIDEIVD